MIQIISFQDMHFGAYFDQNQKKNQKVIEV